MGYYLKLVSLISAFSSSYFREKDGRFTVPGKLGASFVLIRVPSFIPKRIFENLLQ